ncbi:hypothetical protein COOONC_09718 [Cooperia oncophora]
MIHDLTDDERYILMRADRDRYATKMQLFFVNHREQYCLESTVDSLSGSLTKEQEDQAVEYMENAHTAIDRAERLAIELEAKRISIRECAPGEARELIKRYPVTDDNYMLAIDLIKKKYGNKAELVRVLQKRLDNAKADKPSTQGQRKLLEYIIPLVMQLHKLEVNLDGSYNTQKVLSKFTPRIQRKVLEDLTTQDMSGKCMENATHR